VWVKTVAGKAMPVDAEPSPEGNVALEDGVQVMATVLGPLEASGAREAGQALHLSHFVSCPQSTGWRR
jgi:hypothetical protein